jgi:hypothetical protein
MSDVLHAESFYGHNEQALSQLPLGFSQSALNPNTQMNPSFPYLTFAYLPYIPTPCAKK